MKLLEEMLMSMGRGGMHGMTGMDAMMADMAREKGKRSHGQGHHDY